MPKKGTTNTPGEVLSSAAGGSAGGSFAEDGAQAAALEHLISDAATIAIRPGLLCKGGGAVFLEF